MARTRRQRIPYRYPDHLREQVEQVPARAGVYVFHGEVAELPLYIGKSVNLRSRLLAHLRNRDEARLLAQTRRITFRRTAGEIGALLLEASMVKREFPLLNRRLRRNYRLCSIHLDRGRPALIDCQTIDFSRETACYGLFRSRAAGTPERPGRCTAAVPGPPGARGAAERPCLHPIDAGAMCRRVCRQRAGEHA